MRLKRLICKGFKSFADNTEFEFDSTLTGIVGPNGCGKSNVVDAIKWVLGDQRAKSLRGEEMTDVIFKGADGRDAMPAAEVQIQLEDEEGVLDGRTEVSIGRRLTIDKESSYLINGDPVRLKDVRSAMMDTGLGVGAYSVMEQGRIDAVLSANPEDRRAIFEEAAGISRFKQQKRETLRKLDRTEQNLARVLDLLEERGRRIRSLKIQASRARRYAELRDQLRDQKTALAVREATRLRGAQAENRDKLAAAEAAQAESEVEVASVREDVDRVEEEIQTIASACEELQGQMHELRSQMEGARTRGASLRERAAERVADAEAASARRAAIDDQESERRSLLGEAQDRLAGLEVELSELEEQLAARVEEVSACQGELDALAEQREQARQRMLEWIHKKTLNRNAAGDQEAQIRAVRAREERLEERLRALSAEVETLEVERMARQERRDALAETLAQVTGEEELVRADLEAAEGEVAELGRREAGLREQLSSIGGQVQLLAEVERQMEGLDRGPRYLLQQQPAGLRGRLLDLLEVDLEYGPALEAALGPMVQALVVESRTHANEMLAELQSGRHGRAILLVEDEFAVTRDEAAPELPMGVRPLVEVVRCADHARGLVEWLLRGVCVVESSARAHPDRAELCFVTQAGELLWGPRIEGGHGEAHGGLVVRKAQMQQLREEEAALREQLSHLEEGKQGATGKVETLVDRMRELTDELQQLRGEDHALAGELRRLSDRCEDLGRERETLGLEQDEVRQLGTIARASLGGHLLQDLLLQRAERLEAEAERRAGEALNVAQERTRSIREAEQEVRLRRVACGSECDAARGTIANHEESLGELARNLEELVEREELARRGAEEAREEADACEQEATELAERHAAVAEQREARTEELGGERRRRDACRTRLTELESRRSSLAEETTSLRLEMSELDHRFARTEDRLREETAVELRRCLGEVEGYGLIDRDLPGPPCLDEDLEVLQGPPLPPAIVEAQTALTRLWENEEFDEAEAKKLTQVLQSKLDRLGHVNLDAVRELEESEESYVFLQQEVDDLKESRKALMETLRRLETESRALFEETFAEARNNFQGIFRKLFQGGKADMQLAEGEDSLEAGIDIIAKPPGKQLQSINLLSGGERSLTALAILFAVFKVKPSPFCILDEVDAALDDTNVERFLRVLRDFVGPTQFCIVTHHKRTMAECQKLYGITMQTRGVSSRIAVSLDEVDQVTGDTTGTGPGRLRDRAAMPEGTASAAPPAS